jgi:uncharacterized membrane protein YfcA
MSSVSALVILVTVLVTAFISGIFGMAGGLILMGVLAAMLPVATAMVVHGAVQMVSNGYRAFLWRQYIDWRVFRRYALAAASEACVGGAHGHRWRNLAPPEGRTGAVGSPSRPVGAIQPALAALVIIAPIARGS